MKLGSAESASTRFVDEVEADCCNGTWVQVTRDKKDSSDIGKSRISVEGRIVLRGSTASCSITLG